MKEREIKFRAWIPISYILMTENNREIKETIMAYGFVDNANLKFSSTEEYGNPILEQQMDIASFRTNQDGGHICNLDFEKDKAISMQFTGLKDKNGKEIYEGDIVRTFFISNNWGSKIGVVTWLPKSARFMIVNKKQKCGINNRPEVIGNIYENMDLLLKEK